MHDHVGEDAGDGEWVGESGTFGEALSSEFDGFADDGVGDGVADDFEGVEEWDAGGEHGAERACECGDGGFSDDVADAGHVEE